jgi:hypothetical protein
LKEETKPYSWGNQGRFHSDERARLNAEGELGFGSEWAWTGCPKGETWISTKAE